MKLIALKTPLLEPGCNLVEELKKALNQNKASCQEGDVILIASKVVSYSESRLETYESDQEFEELVKRESEKTFEGGMMTLSLKNDILIPNAGIDNSNVPDGKAILWPKEPFESARGILKTLKGMCAIEKLGVVITDSHCQPLRQGVSGIAIGWAGFDGVRDDRGTEDLFGKELKYTQTAVADNLASAAELLMGGGDQSTPFVIARGLEVTFTEKDYSSKDYLIDPKECLFRSIYNEKTMRLFSIGISSHSVPVPQ